MPSTLAVIKFITTVKVLIPFKNFDADKMEEVAAASNHLVNVLRY